FPSRRPPYKPLRETRSVLQTAKHRQLWMSHRCNRSSPTGRLPAASSNPNLLRVYPDQKRVGIDTGWPHSTLCESKNVTHGHGGSTAGVVSFCGSLAKHDVAKAHRACKGADQRDYGPSLWILLHKDEPHRRTCHLRRQNKADHRIWRSWLNYI